VKQLLAGCGFLFATLSFGQQSSETAQPVVRFIEEVWNQGNTAALQQIAVPHAKFHYRDITFTDIDAVVKRWRTGFPDFHFTIEDTIVEGDKVAMRMIFTGTQQGTFWGNPPSGRKISVTQTGVCTVSSGKLKECWEDWDEYGMRIQLGLLPDPAGGK
jgi:predicted ester cyclase